MNPARSAFVESPSSRSTPRLPSSASLPTSVRSPSTGVWSSFQSPVWKTRPAAVSIAMPTASGIECAIRTNSSRNGPSSSGGAFRVDLAQLGGAQQAVLVELRLDEPERQPRRPDLAARHLAHQVRQRADVILVRVGEHDARTSLVAEVAEVGEDQVDAEVLVAREREPGVDDDLSSADLEDGHVLADLAEAAERDHAQYVVAHRGSVVAAAASSTRRRAGRGARGRLHALELVSAWPRRAAGDARRPRGRAASARP